LHRLPKYPVPFFVREFVFLLSRELDTREQKTQHTGTTNVKKEQEVSEMKTHFFFFFFLFFYGCNRSCRVPPGPETPHSCKEEDEDGGGGTYFSSRIDLVCDVCSFFFFFFLLQHRSLKGSLYPFTLIAVVVVVIVRID